MRPLAVVAAALAVAPSALAGGPEMRVGAAEDVVKQPTLVGARAHMTELRLAGFDSVRITAIWAPGETEPSASEAAQIRNAVTAARLAGVRVYVSVYHFGSRTTPLTDEARAQFASFAAAVVRANPYVRDVIVGNEPNLNRFWLPQYGEDGSNVAAPAYLQLLAQTYDALKAVTPQVRVVGGALAPRGIDRPGSGRDTHSPTKFIRDLGAAYRASGRVLPVMDALAIHPYGDSSQQAPRDSAHPRTSTIGLADYGKLVALLAEAFDGTAQPGSTLPIVYDEYGVEATPPPEKEALYTGEEPRTVRPVDEVTQGAYYAEAIAMAFCQPNVAALLLFHTRDEVDRDRWQSGVYYPDGTPKASLPAVQKAAGEARRGVVARCPGLRLVPKAVKVVWPRAGKAGRPLALRLACSLDCRVTVRIERDGRLVRSVRAEQVAGVLARHAVATRGLAPGRYRLRLMLRAPLNPGPTAFVAGPALLLR